MQAGRRPRPPTRSESSCLRRPPPLTSSRLHPWMPASCRQKLVSAAKPAAADPE